MLFIKNFENFYNKLFFFFLFNWDKSDLFIALKIKIFFLFKKNYIKLKYFIICTWKLLLIIIFIKEEKIIIIKKKIKNFNMKKYKPLIKIKLFLALLFYFFKIKKN
jgi:hypothetical protein